MDPYLIKTLKQFLLLILSGVIIYSCSSKPDYKKAEEYIRESEKQWAECVANGDTSVIVRILADDFLGVDPDGSHYNKQEMVKGTSTAPQYFISNHLNAVKIRFYGTTAVAQGDETWMKRKDSSMGKFVWTDTWLYRDGKWQIVASEDLITPAK